MADDPATSGSGTSGSGTWGSAGAVPSHSGWTVRRFATIDSTNRWLLDEARAGAPAGLVAVADHQDAGRGRRGRIWEAEPGSSLLVSVLLRPELPVEHVHVITMAAGLAIADAVEHVAGVVAGLKWPNDLVVDDRKLAGLLTEVDVAGRGAAPAIVVGIGCNVTQAVFPADLAATATSCAIEAVRTAGQPPITRDSLLDAFLERFRQHLGALGDVPAAYRARLATLGRFVRVDLGGTILEGLATGVDDAGRLVIQVGDDEPVALAAGDVVHLRHPPG